MISKNVHREMLDEIVDKYNKTYHGTTKLNPVDVKWVMYIEYAVKHNDKDSKFKADGCVIRSKYKKHFAKGYIPNWSVYVFVIKKIRDTVPWIYVISDLTGEGIAETFYEQQLLKTSQEIDTNKTIG